MSLYLYPRLPRPQAERLIIDQAEKTLVDLRAGGALMHPRAAPAAVGGKPVSPDLLQELQDGLRGIMDNFNFPQPLSQEGNQQLDRRVGTYLFAHMSIIPGDAAEEGVWSFMSLVLVPELAPWRFPTRSPSRLMGGPRNTLRRVWWRAWALGPDLEEAPGRLAPFTEDEYVQIMERTSVAGNRRITQAIKTAVWEAESTVAFKLPRTDLIRGLLPRVRATLSHTLIDILSDDELAALLKAHVQQVLDAR